jgi:hypothetical protein
MKLKSSIISSLIIVAVLATSFSKQNAYADPGREFLMSVTYGTLAGTLLGTASLAFTDQPSEKLQRIARGASLGLYFGILLGLYVVYGVSDERDELDRILPADGYDDYGFKLRTPLVYPTLSDLGKFDGAFVEMTIYKF